MQNLQNLVATFHEKFGHPCFSDVNFDTLRSKAVAELRLSLLKEEIEEGVTAPAGAPGPARRESGAHRSKCITSL